MNKILITIFLLLLSILILGGGYFLVTKTLLNKNETGEQPGQNTIKKPTTEGKKIAQESPKTLLLKAPDASASAVEKIAYDRLLRENARDSGIVFINKDCDISPTIAKIKKNSELKLINEDEETHIIKIGDTDAITLEDKKIETIKADYPLSSLTVYCDLKLSGYIYVEL